MEQSKACSRCKQVKSTSEFGKHTKQKDGLYSQCFSCRRQARAEYRARNVETIKAEQRNAYLKNRDQRIAYATNWVNNNKDRHKTFASNWKHNNKLAVSASARKRRARLKENGIFLITVKEIKRLYSSTCFYCGSNKQITIDHVIAIARGGTDGIGNLVPACKSCNSKKRDLTIMEWRKKRQGR